MNLTIYNFSYNSQKRQNFLQAILLKEKLSFLRVVGKVVEKIIECKFHTMRNLFISIFDISVHNITAIFTRNSFVL